MGLARGNRFFDRSSVHPRHHQDAAGFLFLDNRRDQAVGVKFELVVKAHARGVIVHNLAPGKAVLDNWVDCFCTSARKLRAGARCAQLCAPASRSQILRFLSFASGNLSIIRPIKQIKENAGAEKNRGYRWMGVRACQRSRQLPDTEEPHSRLNGLRKSH